MPVMQRAAAKWGETGSENDTSICQVGIGDDPGIDLFLCFID